MTLSTIIILILIGVAAGMLSGLVGVGGGIIIVPALVYLLGYSQKNAQGTSLAVLVLPVAIVSVFYYYKAGYINLKVVPLICVGFLIGGYFGSKLVLSLPENTVKKIFAIIMILVAIKMLFVDKAMKGKANQTETTIKKT